MEWLVILLVPIIVIPLVSVVLNSIKSLGVKAASYYDFTPIFNDTKPWTVGLYLLIIAAIGLFIFIVSGVGFIQITA